MGLNLRKLQEEVKGRGASHAVAHGVSKSPTQLSNRITTTTQRSDVWLPRGRGEGEGCTWSLGLVNANYYI